MKNYDIFSFSWISIIINKRLACYVSYCSWLSSNTLGQGLLLSWPMRLVSQFVFKKIMCCWFCGCFFLTMPHTAHLELLCQVATFARARERTGHNTENFVPYSFWMVCGFLIIPQLFTNKGSYLRKIVDEITKAALSPYLFKDHEYWFSQDLNPLIPSH